MVGEPRSCIASKVGPTDGSGGSGEWRVGERRSGDMDAPAGSVSPSEGTADAEFTQSARFPIVAFSFLIPITVSRFSGSG
ncbi:hypothetical protein CKAH01_16369 [Colletotrichum kahawae]|uniref:Uncharacterized protein n=1 Tax=Colletotrichum kahawae TaxID=34407 RepID=A0AAD9YG27_COLKA|nr:hypothetical protein CKAH01_16369 [Colletotrichum kahawae]